MAAAGYGAYDRGVATAIQLQVQSPGATGVGEIAVALTAPSAVRIAALLFAAAAPLFLLGKFELTKSRLLK